MSSHLASEEIVAYVEEGLAPPRRSAVEAHLANCRECRREATEVGLFLSERKRRRAWRIWGPTAAAVAAVIALVVVSPWESPAPVSTAVRGVPGEAETLTRVETVFPADEAVVQPGSVDFAWRPAATGAFYRLTITDETGAPVWEIATTDTLVEPGPSAPLDPGRRYFWFVDASLPDGGEATSGVKGFRIAEP